LHIAHEQGFTHPQRDISRNRPFSSEPEFYPTLAHSAHLVGDLAPNGILQPAITRNKALSQSLLTHVAHLVGDRTYQLAIGLKLPVK
jgi:hypothetical protein